MTPIPFICIIGCDVSIKTTGRAGRRRNAVDNFVAFSTFALYSSLPTVVHTKQSANTVEVARGIPKLSTQDEA